MTRRHFLQVLLAGCAASVGLGGYAFGYEPRFRLEVVNREVRTPAWPAGRKPLRIAVVADIHACEPWMPVGRIGEIVDVTLAQEPDLIAVLGDIAAGMRRFRTAVVPTEAWAAELSRLKAPLGVHAVLGNHDWWTDPDEVRRGLKLAGIPLYENRAIRLDHDGGGVWLAGIADQIAHPLGNNRFRGEDDLPGTLAAVSDGEPVILLVHEPDIFVDVPERVAVTLAGHTHGGQVRLPFLGRPIIPSAYGQRFAYGHIVEDGRNLVVSAGLGCSILPVRFMVPPEITMVTVSPAG